MTQFTYKGNPISVNHAYSTNRQGRRFLSDKGKQFKEEIGWLAAQESDWYENDVTVELHFYFGDKRKRDIDNGIKISLDALTGVMFGDDSQITELHVFKRYDKNNPRIEFVIYE